MAENDCRKRDSAQRIQPVQDGQTALFPDLNFAGKRRFRAWVRAKMFAPEEKAGRLWLVASRDAREGSLKINQDTSVYNSILQKDEEISYEINEKRYAWLQIAKGSLEVNGESLNAGDGVAVSEEQLLKL